MASSCPACGSAELEEGGPGAGFGAVCTTCGFVLQDAWLVPEPGGPASGRTLAAADDGGAAARQLMPPGRGGDAHGGGTGGTGRTACFSDVAQSVATKAARTRRVKQMCAGLRLTGVHAADVALVVERAVADAGACTAALLGGAAYLVIRQHRLPVTLPEVAAAVGCPARDVARRCVRLGAQQAAAGDDNAPLPPTDSNALMRRAMGALFPAATISASSAAVSTAGALLRLACLCDLMAGCNPRAWAAAALHHSCACHAGVLRPTQQQGAPSAGWPATRVALAAAMQVGEDTVSARLRELHAAITWLALGCGLPQSTAVAGLHASPAAASECMVAAPTQWLLTALLPSLGDEDVRTAVQTGQARVLAQGPTDGGGGGAVESAPLHIDGPITALVPATTTSTAPEQQQVALLPASRTRRRLHELRPLGAKRTRGPSAASSARQHRPSAPAASRVAVPRARAARKHAAAPLEGGGEGGALVGVNLGGNTLHDVIADEEWAHLLRSQDEVDALKELHELE